MDCAVFCKAEAPFEWELNPYMTQLLIYIVTNSDGRLNPKYRQLKHAKELLQTYLALLWELQSGWESGSFRMVRMLGECIIPAPALCILTHLQKFFDCLLEFQSQPLLVRFFNLVEYDSLIKGRRYVLRHILSCSGTGYDNRWLLDQFISC